MTTLRSETLDDPALIAELLALNPTGLGGVWIRARHGPQREALTRAFTALPYPNIRITKSADDLALFGGLDVNQTLVGGKPVIREGQLARPATLWLQGIEGMEAPRQTRIARAMEGLSVIILLDEGTEDDHLPHRSLREACAFFLHEGQATFSDAAFSRTDANLDDVEVSEDHISLLTEIALRAGVDSIRPLLLATEALKTLMALDDVSVPRDHHFATVARLVFGHRALVPAEAEAEAETPEDDDIPSSDPPPAESAGDGEISQSIPHEMMVSAIQTALPGDVLAALVTRTRISAGAGKGAERASLHKGRPLPSRQGRLGGKARPDILATLQAATPWQRLRGGTPGRVAIRPEDVRIRRYRDHSERLIIFLVDASGSAALARLAEGKGAVETLLSRAYAERDFVSMIVFRDMGAELVLAPTRALVRAKNALASLPAGGATPLASGLHLAMETALHARRRGQTPQIVLISDGRANRALDGAGNRHTAREDAEALARYIRAENVPVTLLDTARRPSREMDALAGVLGSRVVQMPQRMSDAIASLIDAGS